MNHLIYKLFLCLSFFILSSCDSPKLTQLQTDDVILAFGDSLTVGVGTTTENSYPSKLEQLTGIKVVNTGVSGETTHEGLQRFETVIETHQPNLIILIEGGNDILQNKNYNSIKQNLEKMINIAMAQNVEVVLLGVPEKKLLSNTTGFYKELADEYDLVFDGKLLGRLMRDSSKKSDPLHFNQAGYELMAENIYELLEGSGAF